MNQQVGGGVLTTPRLVAPQLFEKVVTLSQANFTPIKQIKKRQYFANFSFILPISVIYHGCIHLHWNLEESLLQQQQADFSHLYSTSDSHVANSIRFIAEKDSSHTYYIQVYNVKHWYDSVDLSFHARKTLMKICLPTVQTDALQLPFTSVCGALFCKAVSHWSCKMSIWNLDFNSSLS